MNPRKQIHRGPGSSVRPISEHPVFRRMRRRNRVRLVLLAPLLVLHWLVESTIRGALTVCAVGGAYLIFREIL